MVWFALFFVLAYLVIGFGLRALIQFLSTGDAGLRLAGGRFGGSQWWAGRLFGAAVLLTVAAPVAGLAGLNNVAVLDRSWLAWLGLAVSLLGMLATIATQLAMGLSWRIGVDTEERTALVTTGPFRMVRNPIFTSMLIAAAGLVMMLPNLVSIFAWVLLLIGVQLQVRIVEEPYLRRVQGAPYEEYTATAGRFLPGIGRVR